MLRGDRLIREPLLHFLVLGGLLFALYGWMNRGGFNAPDEIVVSSGEVQNLRAQFERLWTRKPTQVELQGLIDTWVREEIYYREGVAMGLDRDDPVVRRRVGQKVEFILDSAQPVAPTTPELQAWLDAHPEQYAVEPRYTLQQLYFDPVRLGSNADARLAAILAQLDRGEPLTGDATMLPASVQDASTSDLIRTYGRAYTDALAALPVDSWQGPIRSGFGLHLVRIDSRDDGRAATLAEVRDQVERDLQHARTVEANDAFYERLRSNYTVRIEDLAA